MRVRADTELLDLVPGQRADITLDVINTGQVIDGVTARIVGLPEQHVSSRPSVLPLFPDSSGQMTLTLGLPTSFPAGRHPMTVEVHSRQPGTDPAYVDVDLVVPQAAAVGLTCSPQLVRAHRNARFILTVTNRGNVALDVALKANDPEKAISVVLAPSRLTVQAGQAGDVVVSVRGPRMILGTDLDRLITLTGLARPVTPEREPVPAAMASSLTSLAGPGIAPPPAELIPDGVDGELESPAGAEPLSESTVITLRQRPWFTRGMLTAVILLAIIALWASVFLFGLGQVFAGDPLTKSAPASFFATASAPADQAAGVSQAAVAGNNGAPSAPGSATAGGPPGGASGAGGTAAGSASGGAAGAAGAAVAGSAASGAAAGGEPPAGSLPKTGAMPAGLGGTVVGTVTAATDGAPVGRILVEALRTKADGSTVVVSSAATQSDGTFQVAGLFPGSYQLRFSAAGFTTVYHPAAASQAASATVVVASGAVTAGANAVITGLPATITGSIDPGDTLDKVVATVAVRPLGGRSQGKTVATVKTAANGSYTIPKLPAPGSYQLIFTAPGYQPTTVQTDVSGGAQRFEPSVLLSSGLGQIVGTVTDGTTPLGGITVSTTVGGTVVSTGTPTTGQVGQFVLGQLPTPATYVITVSGPGFGAKTVVVDLGPGKANNSLKVVLDKGTGTVSGVLVDATGKGVGGAVVTVGGAADPPTTTTLTAGVIGSFSLSGLPSPGSYTLSFTLPGYADATVPVNLVGTTPPAPLKVVMAGALGRITGQVTGPGGQPLQGASVIATDGKRSWPVTSTAASGTLPNGGYVIDQLPAGIYTITATSPTGVGRTALVTVTAGTVTQQNFPLSRVGEQMRVSVTPQRIELAEETPFKVTITVTNTGDLIGGYHLRILGADPSWVRLETENLSLFPDTSQTVTATVTIPRGLGAGDRRIAVQVREITPPQAISVAEIDILVPSRAALRMALSPMTVICGGTARFGIVLENTGNTTVTAQPIGLDPEEKIQFTFLPAAITLAPGEHAITDMKAKAKRRWFGTPVVRTFGLAIAPEQDPAAMPDPAPAPTPSRGRTGAGAVTPAKPKIEPLATGSMLQKARVARGAISLLSLLLAVTVFAVVITIALSRLVGVSAADRDLAIQVAAARDSNSTTGTSTLGGTVKLLTDGAPAAGVAVELFDAGSLVAPLISTATNDKGIWTLPSLAAGSYKLRFRGAGFAEIWYPAALTGADATAVDLQAGQKIVNIATTLGGLPATVSGTVLGDDVAAAILTVSVPAADLPRGGAPPGPAAAAPVLTTAQPVPPAGSPAVTKASAAATAAATTAAPTDSANGGAVVQTLPIGADGSFSVANLPSPAVYDLTVSKAGYATASQRIDLSGGENRQGVQLRLRTGDGLISGTVTSPAGPLPNAVVTATTGKTVATTVSLTQGAIGTFTLRGLVTPGTYTVTVTAPGYTTASSTLTLASGQRLTGVQLALSKSSGSLTGLVTLLPAGTPAPGVTVTITTGATTVSTVTQSTGSIGAWTVAGLPVPGAYTVTFSRADLQSQTVAVSLDATGRLTGGSGTTSGGIAVGMRSASAVINGTVTQRAANGTTQKVGEAVITLSSGTNTYTVNSASLPSTSLGRYEITGITPGTYTLSANRPGTSPTTVIITVTAGQVLQYDPVMIPPAAISGHVKDRTGGTVLGLVVDLYQASRYPSTIYRTTTTDVTGAYSFPDVDAPQAYVVEVRSTTAGALGSATLVLAASQAAVLDLTIGQVTLTTTPGNTTPPPRTSPSSVATTTGPATPTTPTTPTTATTSGTTTAPTTPTTPTAPTTPTTPTTPAISGAPGTTPGGAAVTPITATSITGDAQQTGTG